MINNFIRAHTVKLNIVIIVIKGIIIAKVLTIVLFFVGFFHVKISLSDIFEDYIHNQKIKDVANILVLILSIIIPVIILILLI